MVSDTGLPDPLRYKTPPFEALFEVKVQPVKVEVESASSRLLLASDTYTTPPERESESTPKG